MSEPRKRSKKTVYGASLLAGAALLAGVGAFASFSDTETATRSVDAGQLDLAVDGTYTVTDMAPGDIHSNLLTVSLPAANNDGELVQSITFETAIQGTETPGQEMDNGVAVVGSTASLFSDASGLRVVMQNCIGGAWTAVGTTGTFTCDGTVKDVLGSAGNAAIADTADITSGVKVDAIDGTVTLTAADFGVTGAGATLSIPDGSELNLLVTMALPGDDNFYGATAAAGNAFENAAAAIDFNLTANQRAGIEK